jgi:hypothetical protein
VVNGRLRCLGPAQHLKLRFGNGFEVNIKLQAPSQEALSTLLQAALPPLRATERLSAARNSQDEQQQRRLSFSGSLWPIAAPTAVTVPAPAEQPAEVLSPLEEAATCAALSDAEAATSALRGPDDLRLRRAQLAAVCEGLGKGFRAAQVAPFQSGALLHDTFLAEGEEVPLRMILEWWLCEDASERLHAFMLQEFGAKAQLLERSTALNFRYRLQLADAGAEAHGDRSGGEAGEGSHSMQSALSDIFSKFESSKQALGVQEYSVGQTTLEQIFNQFASQQDNPEVQAAAEASAATAAKNAPTAGVL